MRCESVMRAIGGPTRIQTQDTRIKSPLLSRYATGPSIGCQFTLRLSRLQAVSARSCCHNARRAPRDLSPLSYRPLATSYSSALCDQPIPFIAHRSAEAADDGRVHVGDDDFAHFVLH